MNIYNKMKKNSEYIISAWFIKNSIMLSNIMFRNGNSFITYIFNSYISNHFNMSSSHLHNIVCKYSRWHLPLTQTVDVQYRIGHLLTNV